jgi:RNA polymerase sigma-70 factor, ECF subfamily
MDQALSVEFLSRLRAFIRRRVPSESDADDLLQEVLLKLLEKGPQIADQSVPAWLFTVARRAVIDRWRARGSVEEPAHEIESMLPEGDQSLVSDLADCMEPLLHKLDDRDGSILRRVDMEGASQTEIARELGVAVSTIKSRVQRARARLHERLLACCEIEHDGRGLLLDYQPRSDGICGPKGCGCQTPKVT